MLHTGPRPDIDQAGPVRSVPWWAVVSAICAPVTVLAATVLGQWLYTRPYNPVAQTMSVLAGVAGRAAEVVTVGFMIAAACHFAMAHGLRTLPRISRFILAAAGTCGMILALARQTNETLTCIHLTATGAGAILMAIWPLSTIASGAPICRARLAVPATIVLSSLLLWLGFEALHGPALGLAERVCVLAETAWPIVIALGVRQVRATADSAAIATETASEPATVG
ncbi:MAG: DUF998 domain-containing protein [Nocardia sp.]|nr:DUF998 domain-containing protein [Nocardia sp.]